MSNKISNSNQDMGKGSDRLKRTFIPVLALLLIVAIVVWLHLFYGRHPERLIALQKHLYWGAFLASLIGNATILLPGAVLVILSNIGVLLYSATGPIGPIIVGLLGGAGAAIGEMTGYVAGYSGRVIIKKYQTYNRVESWMRKWGAVAIFIFALVPFVFDLVGLAAGVLRFPLWKFLLLSWLGRSILYVVIILLAAMGWQAILPRFG